MARYHRVCSFVVFVALLIIAPSFAFAWGPKGHQIVAYIAEAHLTETARQKIKVILPKNGTFGQSLDLAG